MREQNIAVTQETRLALGQRVDAGLAETSIKPVGYLEKNIHDLLAEFPALGEVLNEYGIGCVTCTVGTCQMGDIVKYHALAEDRFQELMVRMARVMDPDGDIQLPTIPAAAKPVVSPEIKYSPPMRGLVREHTLIKRWLALIPSIISTIDLESETDRQLMNEGINFIRSYADRFHHAKEEEILFKRFDENLEILRVMLADHINGRNHVKAMLAAADARDREMLVEHLNGYRDLLREHIRKEDEILYPWMDRQLSTTQIGELYRDFTRADASYGPGIAERYERFIEHAERLMKGKR